MPSPGNDAWQKRADQLAAARNRLPRAYPLDVADGYAYIWDNDTAAPYGWSEANAIADLFAGTPNAAYQYLLVLRDLVANGAISDEADLGVVIAHLNMVSNQPRLVRAAIAALRSDAA